MGNLGSELVKKNTVGETQSEQLTDSGYSRKATFGPEGQALIAKLSGGESASDRYNKNVLSGADQEALKAQLDKESQSAAASNMAGQRLVRGGGRDGGAETKQAISPEQAKKFQLARATGDAAANYAAAEAAARNKAEAAGGLSANTLALLSALRGESGKGKTAASGTEGVKQKDRGRTTFYGLTTT